MAQKGLCSIRLAPLYQKIDSELLDAIGSSPTAQEFIARYDGWDAAQVESRRRMLAWTLGGVDPVSGKYNLEASLQRHLGTLYRNVLKKDGSLRGISPEQLGFYTKLTGDLIEASAAGVQDVAQKWLAKANEGQLALEEGAQLMRLVDGLTTMTSSYNQGALQLGRGLRQMGLNMDQMRFKQQFDTEASDVEDIANFKNTFEVIADLFNSGDVEQGISELQVVASRIASARDPMEVFRTTRHMKSLPRRIWEEVFINGMLWGPQTAVANATGVVWAFAKPVFQLLAAQGVANFGNSQSARRAAAEASAKLTAMYQGFGDGWKLAYNAFETEKSIFGKKRSLENDAGPAITYSNIKPGLEKLVGRVYSSDGQLLPGNQFAPDGSIAELIDRSAKFYRLPSRLMMGTDELVKHLAMRGEAAAMGVRRAFDEGGLDDYFEDSTRFASWVEAEIGAAFDPGWSPRAAYEYAARLKRQADVATFQESNVIATGVNTILSVPFLGPVLRPFFPFVRTPLNILKQGFVESTGLDAVFRVGRAATGGAFFSKPLEAISLKNLNDLGDEAEGYRVLGQIAFTSTMIGFFYAGAMSGWITGGGPGRWENRSRRSDAQAIWLKAGNVPYSIRIPGTNTVMPFDRLGEPLAGVLRVVTDMAMYSGYATQEEQDAVMFGLANVAVTGLYQQTFLSGLRTLMDAFTNDTDDGVLKGRLVQNWLTAQTPMGGMINYVANITDPYKTIYEGAKVEDVFNAHEGGFSMFFEKIASRVPGRGGQPLLVDQVTGNPIPQIPGIGTMGLNALQLAVPFFPRGIPQADETWQMIGRLTPVLRDKESPIRLTASEKAELNQRMSKIRVNGVTYEQAIRNYYHRPDVQRFVVSLNGARPDADVAVSRKLRDIGRKYLEAALDQMVNSNDSLRMRYATYKDMQLADKASDQGLSNRLKKQLDDLFEYSRLNQ